MSSQQANPDPEGVNFTKDIHSEPYEAILASRASDLSGRSVFITGAATKGGVGRATAIAFAEAGASYIALGDIAPWGDLEQDMLKAAKVAGRSPPQILLLTVDITNTDSTNAAAARVRNEFGNLDILINNAGYLAPYVPLLDSDPEDFWRPWDVNVKGAFNMTRSFLPLLLSKSDSLKSVVNVSSAGALIAIPGGGSYRTSKLAVLRWTEVLDLDYKAQGLTAYCIHPGAIKTTLGSKLPASRHHIFIDQPELAAHTLAWLTQTRRP